MPALPLLPVELVRQILSSLDPASLASISLVSRHFNTLAEPLLYATVNEGFCPLLPQLLALVARPELIRHVRRIKFVSTSEALPSEEECAVLATAAAGLDIPELATLIPTIDTSPDAPWTDPDIRWPDPDVTWADPYFDWTPAAQSLLLLHLIPSVRELSFTTTPLLIRFVESTIATPTAELPFQKLVKFDCEEYSQSSPVTLLMLFALLRLPSLRHITVDMCGAIYDPAAPGVLPLLAGAAGTSAVTHLSLHYGNAAPSTLALILRVPRALTHLSYSDDEQYEVVPDALPFCEALRGVRGTLQSLTIGPVLALRIGTAGAQTIGCFGAWSALTDMTCMVPQLLGLAGDTTHRLVDVLPPRLRRLAISRVDRRTSRARREHAGWTVEVMVDMLVEVLQQRCMCWVKVETAAGKWSMPGSWGVSCAPGKWENPYVDDVRRRLCEAAEAGASRGCVIVCH